MGECCILHSVCAAEGDILKEEEAGWGQDDRDDNSDEDDTDEREMSGNSCRAKKACCSRPIRQICLHVWVSLTRPRGQNSADDLLLLHQNEVSGKLWSVCRWPHRINVHFFNSTLKAINCHPATGRRTIWISGAYNERLLERTPHVNASDNSLTKAYTQLPGVVGAITYIISLAMPSTHNEYTNMNYISVSLASFQRCLASACCHTRPHLCSGIINLPQRRKAAATLNTKGDEINFTLHTLEYPIKF